MSIDDEFLKRLWIKRYGNNAWAKDCYGYWIYYFDRGRDCPRRTAPNGNLENCGWEIDHIYPEAKGGSDAELNLEFVYCRCNEEKSDKLIYTLFNNKTYEIRRRFYKAGYGIYSIRDNKFIDWESNH